MINTVVRIISIVRMKLLMLPKAKNLDNFACKMGLQTSRVIIFSHLLKVLIKKKKRPTISLPLW